MDEYQTITIKIYEEYMKPVAVLIQEHKTIKKMIGVLKALSQDQEKLKKLSLESYNKIIDFFHVYADLCHHGKEEKILFDRLKKKPMSEEDRSLMDQLIKEHQLARQLLKELDQMKQSKDYQKIADQFVKITKLYDQHIDKENKKFFLPAFSYFSEEEIKEVVAGFVEVDKKMIHEKYLSIVQDLESAMQM